MAVAIKGRMVARSYNPQWLVNIPELATRPLLLTSLQEHADVRRKLFQLCANLESIACIPCRHTAERCLALWWREAKRDLQVYWHDKLRARTGSDQLFNELRGCLQNVYLNMRIKAGATDKLSYRRDHDVVRKYATR